MSLSAQVVVRLGSFTLDVGVEVADREVVAVLGPNGAGKTTLLRALAGLTPLTGGAASLGGVNLDDHAQRLRIAPQDRRVGVVFQDYRLFPHLSVLENVAFGPRSTGAPRGAARVAARGWLERLGVAALADRTPAQLSGGQAQRVALARALATDPALMLLDEPLAALDAGARDEVRHALRGQLAQFAGPVLLVTHDLLDALFLADRIVVLEGGRIAQDASAFEVTHRPLTPYVARVVGLNLYSGTAGDGVLTVATTEGGGRLPVTDRHLRGPAFAVIRPAAVRLLQPDPVGIAPDSPVVTWPGWVQLVESLGDRVRVHLRGAPPIRVDLDPRDAAHLLSGAGQELTVQVPVADIDAYPAGDASR